MYAEQRGLVCMQAISIREGMERPVLSAQARCAVPCPVRSPDVTMIELSVQALA